MRGTAWALLLLAARAIAHDTWLQVHLLTPQAAGGWRAVDAGMRPVHRLRAQVPSIGANVLRRLGLREDATPAGHAVKEALPPIDSRARFEVNFRRLTP